MARRSTRKTAGTERPRRVELPPAARPTRGTRRVVVASAVAVLVAGCAVGAVLLTARGGTRHHTAPPGNSIRWSAVPNLQTTAPPWSSQSSALPSRLAAAGLSRLTMEGSALHIHEHLDVYVHGRKVTVPAFVGIDNAAGFLTELHTHDPSGIIHVESPALKSFTLGQFFCEWGVKLTASCLGRYHGPVSWWVNGVRGHGNPAQLVLQPHQEIVIAAGQPPASVPSGYAFPAGL